MSDEIGRVIGTRESKPLDFWLAVDPSDYVQLDEVVAVTTQLPQPRPDGRSDVEHYGIVDQIESAYEGASFHSDVFRAANGTLPVEISTIAHVAVTRVSMSPTQASRPRWSAPSATSRTRRTSTAKTQTNSSLPTPTSRAVSPAGSTCARETRSA